MRERMQAMRITLQITGLWLQILKKRSLLRWPVPGAPTTKGRLWKDNLKLPRTEEVEITDLGIIGICKVDTFGVEIVRDEVVVVHVLDTWCDLYQQI